MYRVYLTYIYLVYTVQCARPHVYKGEKSRDTPVRTTADK